MEEINNTIRSLKNKVFMIERELEYLGMESHNLYINTMIDLERTDSFDEIIEEDNNFLELYQDLGKLLKRNARIETYDVKRLGSFVEKVEKNKDYNKLLQSLESEVEYIIRELTDYLKSAAWAEDNLYRLSRYLNVHVEKSQYQLDDLQESAENIINNCAYFKKETEELGGLIYGV